MSRLDLEIKNTLFPTFETKIIWYLDCWWANVLRFEGRRFYLKNKTELLPRFES